MVSSSQYTPQSSFEHDGIWELWKCLTILFQHFFGLPNAEFVPLLFMGNYTEHLCGERPKIPISDFICACLIYLKMKNIFPWYDLTGKIWMNITKIWARLIWWVLESNNIWRATASPSLLYKKASLIVCVIFSAQCPNSSLSIPAVDRLRAQDKTKTMGGRARCNQY